MLKKFAALVIGAISSVNASPTPGECEKTKGFHNTLTGCGCIAIGAVPVPGTDICRCLDKTLSWAKDGSACGISTAQKTARIEAIDSKYDVFYDAEKRKAADLKYLKDWTKDELEKRKFYYTHWRHCYRDAPHWARVNKQSLSNYYSQCNWYGNSSDRTSAWYYCRESGNCGQFWQPYWSNYRGDVAAIKQSYEARKKFIEQTAAIGKKIDDTPNSNSLADIANGAADAIGDLKNDQLFFGNLKDTSGPNAGQQIYGESTAGTDPGVFGGAKAGQFMHGYLSDGFNNAKQGSVSGDFVYNSVYGTGAGGAGPNAGQVLMGQVVHRLGQAGHGPNAGQMLMGQTVNRLDYGSGSGPNAGQMFYGLGGGRRLSQSDHDWLEAERQKVESIPIIDE